MNWNLIAKYAAAGILLGSVGVLVYFGKTDAGTYVTLVTGALAGLGVVAVNTPKGPTS